MRLMVANKYLMAADSVYLGSLNLRMDFSLLSRCRVSRLLIQLLDESRAHRPCTELCIVYHRHLCRNKNPSRQVSCCHPWAFPLVRFRCHFAFPIYKKKKMFTLDLLRLDSETIRRQLKTHANLKFFLPWTFSEMTVFDFITSPVNFVGSFPSSFDWSNVKSLSSKNSAFLSGFDLIMILRDVVDPIISKSTRSWKVKKW